MDKTETQKPEKRDWNKIVAESNGDRIFIPEALVPKVKDWYAKRAEFNKHLNEISKEEISNSVALNNIALEIRIYLEANGYKDIWGCDVGIDSPAAEEGAYIVNISKTK